MKIEIEYDRTYKFFKKYNSVTAVDDISFTAKNFRITGLLGANGAGKTTI